MREHLQLLAVAGAFQELPPSMLQGAGALMEAAQAVFSLGVESTDSVQCSLTAAGGADRELDVLGGIPAVQSEVFLQVAAWSVMVLVLAVWMVIVAFLLRHVLDGSTLFAWMWQDAEEGAPFSARDGQDGSKSLGEFSTVNALSRVRHKLGARPRTTGPRVS